MQYLTSPEQPTFSLNEGIQHTAARIGELLGSQQVVTAAIVGGPLTGKSSIICPGIARQLGGAVIISEDNYCVGNSLSALMHGTPNLQVPEDYDPKRMAEDLRALRGGRAVDVPLLDFSTREPNPDREHIEPASVVLVEGAYLLQERLRDLFDIAVFVESDDHSRFIRRLIRPSRQLTQTPGTRLREYAELAYPAYYTQTWPYRTEADSIIQNPYKPGEGSLVVNVSDLPPPDVDEVVTDYRHTGMWQQERIYMSVGAAGIQQLVYMPDSSSPRARLTWRVAEDEYKIDLTKVGYHLYNEDN